MAALFPKPAVKLFEAVQTEQCAPNSRGVACFRFCKWAVLSVSWHEVSWIGTRRCDTVGLGHNGAGILEDCDTTGLGHNRSVTQWDWDTTGL